MCNFRLIITVLLSAVTVAVSGLAEGAALPLTVVQLAQGSYSIKATDLPESSGIELMVSYDKRLGIPKVTPGVVVAGAMMVDDVSVAGTIQIGVMTGGTIKGTGELAQISFPSKVSGTVLLPVILSQKVIDANGSPLAIQADPNAVNTRVSNTAAATVAATGGTTSAGSGTVSQATGASGGQISTTIGSVVLPQQNPVRDQKREESMKQERREEPAANPNVPAGTLAVSGGNAPDSPRLSGGGAAVSVAKNATDRPALKSNQSFIDRFRTYKDVRSLKKLAALFDASALRASGYIQQPAVAVSDGKSMVTLSLELASEAETPSFSLKGANQKAIRRISNSKWEIDLLPQKDKTDVQLTLILKGERIEVPLAVVPPLNHTGIAMISLPDSAVESRVARPAIGGKPSYDLNSDGRQDYIDDYILIGHLLRRTQAGAVTAPKQSQPVR